MTVSLQFEAPKTVNKSTPKESINKINVLNKFSALTDDNEWRQILYQVRKKTIHSNDKQI